MYGVIKRVSAALLVSFFFSSLVTFFFFIPNQTLLAKWEPKLDVQMRAYFLRGMKTKWRSYNHKAAHIRLNTELVKKPKDLIEYVVVHEMVHLIEPMHSNQFILILHKNYPTWREARTELHQLSLTAEVWRE